MAGFLSGFFGSRRQAAEKAEKVEVKKDVKVSRPVADTSEAYFLDSDQAKTMGDIDYMRTAKTVKRTYAKTVSQPQPQAFIQSVSSSQAKLSGQAQQSSQSESNGATANAPEVPDRRRSDTSLDRFRTMAKDLRKSK
jgi:hypothetical protein